MKRVAIVLSLGSLLANVVAAETMVCAYLGYAQAGEAQASKPVIVDIRVERDVAYVGRFSQRYTVLQNTKHGLVLAESFAAPEDTGKAPRVGAFVLAIDRQTGKMVRNNVLVGEPDAYREGTCKFQAK